MTTSERGIGINLGNDLVNITSPLTSLYILCKDYKLPYNVPFYIYNGTSSVSLLKNINKQSYPLFG